MKKLITSAILSLTVFVYQGLAKEVKYNTYVYGINVGKITIKQNGNNITVEGKTRRAISWLYNYAFKFKANGNKYYLYERENGKPKVYTNTKIYQKKAWLPLLVDFIRYGEIKKNAHYPFNLRKSGTKYIILPTKSKKVKRIEFKIGKQDRFPTEIFIDGKVDIRIKRER
jgi:hypothetical protein